LLVRAEGGSAADASSTPRFATATVYLRKEQPDGTTIPGVPQLIATLDLASGRLKTELEQEQILPAVHDRVGVLTIVPPPETRASVLFEHVTDAGGYLTVDLRRLLGADVVLKNESEPGRGEPL
jgi:hypothetical protein